MLSRPHSAPAAGGPRDRHPHAAALNGTLDA